MDLAAGAASLQKLYITKSAFAVPHLPQLQAVMSLLIACATCHLNVVPPPFLQVVDLRQAIFKPCISVTIGMTLQVTEGLQAEVPSSVLPHLPLLRAAAQMELAGALQYYRRMGEAAGQLRTASRTLDVTLSVTGALLILV